IEPDNLGALVLASDSYRAKNDWVPALKYIGKAAVLAPHDARICQKYGNLLCLSGNNEEGLVWLEKAQQLDPKLKNLDFEMGKTCTLLHYNLKAIEALQRAGQRPPVSPEIDFWLGVNFEKLGEWEKARAAYSKCLQQDPANARALCGLGHALSMLKQYAEAEKYLRQALLLDPSLAEAHAHLGRLYRQLNQKEQAVREQLIFDSVSQYQGQAESKGDKVEEEKGKVWEKCIQLVKENQEEQALALLKTLPGVKTATMAKQYYSLGVIYLSLNRLADAKRTLIKARSLNPNGRGVNSTLGMVYLAGKDMGEAEKAFQAELTSHPDEEQALLGFAWLRFAEEKWEEAVTYLERSKTKASDSLLLLCDAYFHLGRTEQGLITAETLAAIAPTDQTILESLIDLLQRQNQAELVARIQKQLAKQSGTAPHN
ncbi:MAG TPA: tetratricopeptide repeat protein, partial [Terriglobia bacterium]|nr:tetratricopeptide repeat protein [Terriglobia bacterium]